MANTRRRSAAAPAGPKEHADGHADGHGHQGRPDQKSKGRRTVRNVPSMSDENLPGRPTARRSIDGADPSIHHAHGDQTPLRVRVYLLTYFFSSLTIDRQTWCFGLIPIGWILSSLAEWLGVPICHTNVQVQSVADPSEVAEFGYEGGPRHVTGVYQCAPGCNPHLAFTRQQKVYLGETDLTHAELVAAVRSVESRWRAPDYNLFTRNCNHFCEALVDELIPGTRMPRFINRGARASCFWTAGLAPWFVRTRVKDGGSWTAGKVTLMAEEERAAMGVPDFAEWEEWAKGDGEGSDGEEVDPLAEHLHPVPLL
jgi:hypothetical protein